MPVEIVRDTGGATIRAHGEHAEPGHQDEPRQSVHELGALEAVRLEVRGVVLDEAVQARLDRLPHVRGIVEPIDVDEARDALGVKRVIRRRGPDLAQTCGVGRADEVENLR